MRHDAQHPLAAAQKLLGPDGGDYATLEEAQTWASISAALALQSIAASLINLTSAEGSGTMGSSPGQVRPEAGSPESEPPGR